MRDRIGEILFFVLLFMLVVATDLCVQLFKAIPPPKSPVISQNYSDDLRRDIAWKHPTVPPKGAIGMRFYASPNVTPGCTITTSAASTAVAIVPLCKMGACVSYVDQDGNESGCVTY